MVVLKFNSEEDWLEARLGTIGGTRAGNLILKSGKGYKQGFWEMLAERVGIPHDGENYMDRGKRLEVEALELFVEKTGKKVNTELVIFCRDDDPRINYSPDGYMGKTEDTEVKCLSSARHLEAWYTKEIPSDYYDQMLQGFVVNDKLKKRYMVFYNPQMPVEIFWLEIHRKDHKQEIAQRLQMERNVLKVADEIEKQLTF